MQINRKQPTLTYILLSLNGVMFVVQFFYGALGDTGKLVDLGAKEVLHITDGQWWRLVTATFLHGSIDHLAMNMISLWIWGRYAEAMMGRGRYLAVYLLSGVAGGAMSYWLSTAVSVGASGALFGLFGAFLYLRVQNKRVFDGVFGRQVLILIAVNLVMTFRPGIDIWGHIGGLIGGFLAAAACGFLGQREFTLWRGLAAAGYVLLLGGACALGYLRYIPYLMP